MKQKLIQNKGETLIEALVAVLIAFLSMAMLCASMLSASKINSETKKADVKFKNDLIKAEALEGTGDSSNVKLSFGNGSSQTVTVKLYGTGGDFVGYDYTK